MALNPKQTRFVAEYLKTGNATQAAAAAGYSEKSARSTGYDLLQNPEVSAAIDAEKAKIADNARVSVQRVLEELARIALADPAQAVTDGGGLKDLHEMPEEIRRAISGIEVEELYEGHGQDREHVGTLRKVKFWDKPKTLELLGKYLKMFTDKVEASGPNGGALEIIIRKESA